MDVDNHRAVVQRRFRKKDTFNKLRGNFRINRHTALQHLFGQTAFGKNDQRANIVFGHILKRFDDCRDTTLVFGCRTHFRVTVLHFIRQRILTALYVPKTLLHFYVEQNKHKRRKQHHEEQIYLFVDQRIGEEEHRAAAKVEAEMRKRHAEVYKKINAWYADGLEQAARDFVGKDGWRVLELYFTFAGYYGWSKPANVAAWAKKKTFDNWWTTCGKDLFYFAKDASVGARNTRQLLKTFKKVKWADVLGKDDLAFVKSDKFGVY